MADESEKNKGPSCACGKVDLYEESLKVHKNKKDKRTDPTILNSVDAKNSLLNDAKKEGQKSTLVKKQKE